MQLGIVGLGRMGANIARRLMRAKHTCVVYDQAASAVQSVEKDGAIGAINLADLVEKLARPRTVWVMLPAGESTEAAIAELGGILSADDCIIDGGNTFYRDDIRRASILRTKHIHYLDIGTSGGVWGLERGYCLMIGGARDVVDRLDPLFAALAPGAGAISHTPGREGRDPRVELGYLHCGPVGSGHFVKMVHNGIEYGLMQAYAEGFDLLKARTSEVLPTAERHEFALADVAEVWRRGSVVSSWLLDLIAIALAEDGSLRNFSGHVEDSGEGRWTVNAAIETAVPLESLSSALFARFRSRQSSTFAERLLSAMRFQFGGHAEKKASK
ncbi:MAG: decarboxylating 6-phosphogluconate dehydrogenase [Rhodospirillaceae bacterium]|nr:decarboxylating 6-phosphogluconate dehydrogenase [Rhodospirillaceae bacterium]